MQAIELEHLSKQLCTLHALQDVHFSVEAGETFGDLVLNGAGKTTVIFSIIP